jgi:transcription elongation factor SPT6
MVNLVGIDLNQVKEHVHLQNQLQFISGLGPRKALNLLDNLKKIFPNGKEIRRRRQLLNEKLLGDTVYRNCSGFFKIYTKYHQDYLENQRVDKKSSKFSIK